VKIKFAKSKYRQFAILFSAGGASAITLFIRFLLILQSSGIHADSPCPTASGFALKPSGSGLKQSCGVAASCIS